MLRNIGVHPEVRPADIDETPRAGEGAAAYVQRLAAAKAAAVARDGEVVIDADTTVSIDGHIIGTFGISRDISRTVNAEHDVMSTANALALAHADLSRVEAQLRTGTKRSEVQVGPDGEPLDHEE